MRPSTWLTPARDATDAKTNHISVCICTYKRATFLGRLLENLRDQDTSGLFTYSVVVADNVRLPGAPKYRAYMLEHEGTRWHTIEHETHLEYQSLIKDLVLESELL